MEVWLNGELIEKIGASKLKPFGIDEEKSKWGNPRDRSTALNLRRLSNSKVTALRDILLANSKVYGARLALADIEVWLEAAKIGAAKAKCRNVRHFSALLFEFMQKQPGYRLYGMDEVRSVWAAYYLGGIRYYEKAKDNHGRVIPAHTIISLYYMELGTEKSKSVTFYDANVRGRSAPEALAAEGWFPETADLLKEYDRLKAKYDAIYDKVGKQFLAVGIGTDDLDKQTYWRQNTKIALDKGGDPSRIVIDILTEGDEKPDRESREYDPDFWRSKSFLTVDEENEEDENTVTPANSTPDPEPLDFYVPVFPVVPTFDLRRHMRLRIHVGNLTEYAYDRSLGEKLVLPDEVRDLVSLLVSDKTEFRDIVKGKGGGAVILCAGPPGCGKTLTAEVYAEVMEMPLYSVQCSQLGTDEEDLEKHLLQVFSRAQRWNAILLLDESDVYVAARGSNLQQNAIVGVFLRVLEYYGGVLFMTTNRSDLVDDAITSRCLARIDYTVPTPENQKRIWKILATGSGIEMPDSVIDEVVTRWPKLSGRDVKQLLKLAAKVAHARSNSVLDFKTIEFVKRFKPTPGNDETPIAVTGKRLVPNPT